MEGGTLGGKSAGSLRSKLLSVANIYGHILPRSTSGGYFFGVSLPLLLMLVLNTFRLRLNSGVVFALKGTSTSRSKNDARKS